MLHIETKKGVFDLGSDFRLQIDETSPVMNDRGSQSVPVSVPATPNNSRLAGFPFRLDCADEPFAGNKDCVVSDGVYRRKGLLNVVSASRKDGITFNIGFDNAELYARWRNKKLCDLDGLPEIDLNAYSTGTSVSRLDEVAEIVGDFAVFPVALEVDEDITICLNDFSLNVTDTTVQRYIDGKLTHVVVPPRYGESGFLYVWRVLELAFAAIGVDIIENPFTDYPELKRLVVLNNCMDACCTGTLRYADLMPSCTVDDFLNALKTRFGLVYNVDFSVSKVRLRLIRDIIRDTPQSDLTAMLSGLPSVSFDAPKYVALSAGTSIEGAAPSTERFEDFIKDVSPSEGVSVAPSYDSALKTPLIYISKTGEWLKYDKLNSSDGNPAYESSTSSFFHWDPATTGLDAEAFSSCDEFVPMKKPVGMLSDVIPHFLVGVMHRHTFIKGCKEDKSDTPLAFLFAFVRPVGAVGYNTIGSWSPAATGGECVEFQDGGEPHRLSLLFQFGNGLFANFWKDYDEVLRHGFRTVEVSASLSLNRINGIEMLRPMVVGGQRMLVDMFSYQLPSKANVQVDFKFRTLRPCGKYDLKAEQGIPVFGPGIGSLQWRYLDDNANANAEAMYEYLLGTFNEESDVKAEAVWLRYTLPESEVQAAWQNDTGLFTITPREEGETLVRKYKWLAEYYFVGGDDAPIATHKEWVDYEITLVARHA